MGAGAPTEHGQAGRASRWNVYSMLGTGRSESFHGTEEESQGLGHLPPPLPGVGQHVCVALLRKQCLRNSYVWPLASPVSGGSGMADLERKVKTPLVLTETLVPGTFWV